jgi:NTE family protein
MQSDDPGAPALFDGVPPDELARLFTRLERRTVEDGATLLTEGSQSHEMYVVERGAADAFVIGPDGREHHVNRLGQGGVLGEMSLLTGQSASATVRAVGHTELLVIGDVEFERIAQSYPRIYHNVGVILSRKVFESDRRALQRGPLMHATLVDAGAPPLLGYAVACSVAWHGQGPTLLLDLTDADRPEFVTRAKSGPDLQLDVRSDRLEGSFAPEHLPRAIRELGRTHDYVLVQLPSSVPALPDGRTVRLGGPTGGNDGPGYEVRAWARGDTQVPDRSGVLTVPDLTDRDERALVQGNLPPESPAGRKLAWVARDLLKQKVGLALGGGGAKGYAHIGVLAALERAGVPVDFIAGTSIGAAVAALYALGHRAESLAAILDLVGTVLVRPALPTRGLLSDAALRRVLQEIGGDRRIQDLHPPLAIVAADITSGREVVFREGLVWAAVLASVAIPGVYPAQRMGAYTLVDGGVVNPVPRDTVVGMGADMVLAVNLRTPGLLDPVRLPASEPVGRPPAIFEVLVSALELLQSRVAPPPLPQPIVEIAPSIPNVAGWGLRNFSAGRAYIELGETAVGEALPRVRALLPWLASAHPLL